MAFQWLQRNIVARLTCVTALVAVTLLCMTSPSTADDPTPVVATTNALPTPQVNGVVWTTIISGGYVYAGGSFTSVTDIDGTSVYPRQNLIRFNLATGQLDRGFNAGTINGEVRALAVSPDGSRLYVGGAFTAVGGFTRYRLAAVNATTGAMDQLSFNAGGIDAAVLSLAVRGDRVYAGGSFSRVGNNQASNRIAAFTTTGSMVDGGVPTLGCANTSCSVQAMTLSPDGSQLVIGGSFISVNGSDSPGYGLARINTSTGAVLPLAANTAIRDAGANGAIYSLTSDATGFYGTGYRYNDKNPDGTRQNNLEGVFKSSWSGDLTWVADCHGDTYSVAVGNGAVYTASHQHYCGNLGTGGYSQTPTPWNHHYAQAFTTTATGVNSADQFGYPSHAGQPSPSLLDFYPDFTPGNVAKQAAWAVSTDGNYVVYGGEFTAVNGKHQQGLVRFATRPTLAATGLRASDAPALEKLNVDGITSTDDNPVVYVFGHNGIKGLTVRSMAAGQLRLTWPGYLDRDGSTLRYVVYRDTSSNPIATVTTTTPWWNAAPMAWTDTTVAPGSTHRYRIKVIDSDGNETWLGTVAGVADWSPWVTSASTGQLSAYASRVLADGATTYWPLTTGGTVTDASGTDDTTTTADSTPTGPIDGTTAVSLSPDVNATSTQLAALTPDIMTEEVWFKTSSSSGGRLAGWADARPGGANADRALTLSSAGAVNFTVARGSSYTISSGTGYNDDRWHQAAATLGPDGMALYVDGVLRATQPSVKAGGLYPGRWVVGGSGFSGALAQASRSNVALTADQVRSHWNASGAGARAAFSWSNRYQTAGVDASTSSVSDSATYSWNFGDPVVANGGTGTGLSCRHRYSAPGTYQVTLRVTESNGATDTITKSVTVTSGQVAIDGFNRTTARGWGSMDSTHTWTSSNANSSALSTSGSAGHIKLATRSAQTAVQTTGIAGDLDLYAEYRLRTTATGGGTVVALTGRASSAGQYRLRVGYLSGGSVRLQLTRVVSGKETTLVTRTVLTKVPLGRAVKVRFALTGTTTTSLAARAWTTATEPTFWQLTAKDSTGGLLSGTGVGVWAQVSRTASTLPAVIDVDRFAISAR